MAEFEDADALLLRRKDVLVRPARSFRSNQGGYQRIYLGRLWSFKTILQAMRVFISANGSLTMEQPALFGGGQKFDDAGAN